MRPSYQELVTLNPRLGRKSSAEVDVLIFAFEQCGYGWDPSEQTFHNPEIGRSLRTQGIDLFTPDEFMKDHNSRVTEIRENPQAYAKYQLGMRLWQKHFSKFIWVFMLTLLLGWNFLPITYWLGVLGLIIVSFWIYKKFTFWLITESGYKGPG